MDTRHYANKSVSQPLPLGTASRALQCIITAVLTAALLVIGACQSIQAPLPKQDSSTASFPTRPPEARTGSQFLQQTRDYDADQREHAILTEILSGNVPRQIRQLVPVVITFREHQATIFVVPNYLAIGSDEDHVVIPMRPRTATQIAREFGYLLPTRKLVNDIYRQATVKLAPAPMPAGTHMRSNAYYRRHNRLIEQQLAAQTALLTLIAGHKKDVVLTPQLNEQPERLAIYGWHRAEGAPIQPLSLYHGANYVDYSHGVRLVSRRAYLDGLEIDLAAIFTDHTLHPLVSDEGAIPIGSYL